MTLEPSTHPKQVGYILALVLLDMVVNLLGIQTR